MDLARTSSASQKLDLPAYDGTPSTYIVASQPRSGSHLLCQLRVTYEELTKDRKAVTGRILEYLGVKEVPSDEVIGADPVAVQRTAINEEWRNRFLSSVELRYDSSQRWRGMLEWDLAAEVAGAGKSSSESSA